VANYKILINTVKRRAWIINKQCPKAKNGYVDVLKHCFNCKHYAGVLFRSCLRLCCSRGEAQLTTLGVMVQRFDHLLALRGGYNREGVKCIKCKNLRFVKKEERGNGSAWRCKIFNISLERLLENKKYSNCIYFVKGR